MSHEFKKGNKRMKHVSYNGEMTKLLAPWTVSLTVNHFEQVTIKNWIMRVKKTVVVDGNDDELSEEAFLAAMKEEEKWMCRKKWKKSDIVSLLGLCTPVNYVQAVGPTQCIIVR